MITKLRAFTLLEMLMSIGIMTLVISMVYFMYVSFSEQVYSYFKDSTSSNEVYGFYSQFRTDAYQANTIIKKGNTLVFNFYNNTEVFYDFDDEKLIRRQLDQNQIIYLGGYSFSNIRKRNNGEILINQIKFETLLLGRKIDFIINKRYPSHFLIELNGY